MKVLAIRDQPNGSAIVDVEMSEKEKDMLIEYGFNAMLKTVIETFEENLEPRKCYKCGSVISKKVLDVYPEADACGSCIDAGVEI